MKTYTEEHTPIPWHYNIVPQMGYYNIQRSDGCVIGRAHNEEDAAFIIKAVNCHDDFMAELKNMLFMSHSMERTIATKQASDHNRQSGGQTMTTHSTLFKGIAIGLFISMPLWLAMYWLTLFIVKLF